MRIEHSNIAMASRHQLEQSTLRTERLRVWLGPARPEAEASGTRPPQNLLDTLHLSGASNTIPSLNTGNNEDDLIPEDGEKTPEIMLVEKIVEMLTGVKVKIRRPNLLDEYADNHVLSPPVGDTRRPQENRAGWGVEYDASVREYERESLDVEMAGIIKTGDGQEINVALKLSLNREFAQESSISVRAGDAPIDPLVINFGGMAAHLTEGTFTFDIDADGEQETLHGLTPGSGYLVVDRNNDGMVNDGSELFGPSTGDGFAELREHDADGNNWIDEDDPAYRHIRVWDQASMKDGSLSTLSEKGVGAIYVGSVSARFSLKDPTNALQGESKQIGIYLTENGTPGTIQELDLVV
jgi:hypothetical protein